MSVSTSRLLSLVFSLSLSSHSCLSLVWRASPFARGRKGLVSCLYTTCTAAARSAAQSDHSTSRLILCGYWYAGRPIRGPLFLFSKRLGLSLPRVLTNQVLNLHEAGDHNYLLPTKSRHLIGQPEYLDSSTILVVTWRDLIGLHSWLQRYKSHIGTTPDPSSLLRRGQPARLVCLTTSPPSFLSVQLPVFFSLVSSLSLPLLSFLSVSLPLFPCLCFCSLFNSCLPPLSLSLLPFSLQKINFFHPYSSGDKNSG